jgi:hypothetical protein
VGVRFLGTEVLAAKNANNTKVKKLVKFAGENIID